MKVKKRNIINNVLYAVFLLSYWFILSHFGMGSYEGKYRYYIFLFASIVAILTLLIRKSIKKCYSKKSLLILLVGIVFLIVSYYKAKAVGMPLSDRTYVQLFLTVIPPLYAFALLNLYDAKDLIKLMKVTLIITIIGYFMESEHTILDFLSIDNWRSVNIFSTHGNFFESSMCAEMFIQLFFFFYYFKNLNLNDNDKKSLRIYTVISIIFTILSFKRLGMLFCVALLFIDKVINFNNNISKKKPIITAFAFCIITIVYTMFIKGEIFTNIDVFRFTSGRDYIFSIWTAKNYFSYGYGTSMLVIGRYLEMDLVQIYMELGIVALFLFCYSYFKTVNNNKYSYMIMIYSFLNMLTASSLPTAVSWIVTFVTIGCISSNKLKDEGYEYKDTSIRIKR